LARLGWSHGDQEVFTRAELVQHFSWDHCGRTAAQYDIKKFQFVQAEHLRKKTPAELAPLVLTRLKDGAVVDSNARLEKAIGTVLTRATTIADAAEMVDFYFREPPVVDDKAVSKFLVKENEPHLRALREVVQGIEPFEQKAIEAAVTAWLEKSGLQMKNVAQPARVAMTGKTQSPGLFEVMEALGKERTLARLDAGAAKAAG
jgi:glutamyl-tRNA synthetase